MKIERNHPKYKIKIDPNDKTLSGEKFGDVPFTQKEFEMEYSDKVKIKDIPIALVKVFGIDKETVIKAWINS